MKKPALVFMLAAVLFINYADRGLLSIAAPLVQPQLHLTDSQLGLLFSAFFWTYTCAQIPVGWIAERFGAGRVLAGGLVLWAVATALVGTVTGFAMLIGLRMLLGIGESAGFPCVAKLLAAAMPVEELGIANGIVGAAYCFGPAAGAFLGGLLMVHFGWRITFIALGAASLLWLLPWRWLAPREAPPAARASSKVPMLTLLRTRALWGTTLGLFCSNYVFFFMLSWLPSYLVRERGFSMAQMTALTGESYTLMAVCSLLGGWAIDLYIKRGGSPNTGYKVTMAVASIGAVGCMLTMGYGSRNLAIAGIFAYQVLAGASAAGLYALSEIFGGTVATGRWVGIQNSGGSLAGVIAPWLTGTLVDLTGHFTMAFLLASAVSLLGLVGWLVLLPKAQAIDWGIAPGAEAVSRQNVATSPLL
jgi:MFS family permease